MQTRAFLSLSRLVKQGLVGFSFFYTVNTQVDIWWLNQGRSMEPTFYQGQIVLTQPSSAWFFDINKIQAGDVVIARDPTDPIQNVCKRVVGTEGHRIPLTYRDRFSYVPSGSLWLEGDNASQSRDSRTYGPVPLGLVRGRVVWPVSS